MLKNFDDSINKLKRYFARILPKYLHIDFQILFPKSNLENPKYIKNVQIYSLRTPGLKCNNNRPTSSLSFIIELGHALNSLEINKSVH